MSLLTNNVHLIYFNMSENLNIKCDGSLTFVFKDFKKKLRA